MSLDRIVPVAYIHSAAWSVAEIDGNKTEVLGEEQIPLIFFRPVVLVTNPLVDLDSVRGLVANLDHPALQCFRPHREVDEFVATDSGVGRDACRLGLLPGVGGIRSSERRLRKIGMTGYMVTPIIKGDSPGIGVRIVSESDQFLVSRSIGKPGRVLGSHRDRTAVST